MSYLSDIRAKIGNDKIICPAARILIENVEGEFVTIIRKDTGRVALPTSTIDQGETIEACIIRAVKEQTGLDINSLHVIGICTNPITQTVQYPNGDVTQYFVVEFYSDDYSGTLVRDDPDTASMTLFSSMKNLDALPQGERGILHSYHHYMEEGSITLS